MKIGSLIVLRDPLYLYQDEPMFPWNKLQPGTKIVVLSDVDPVTEHIKVLVDDGRTGWVQCPHLLNGETVASE